MSWLKLWFNIKKKNFNVNTDQKTPDFFMLIKKACHVDTRLKSWRFAKFTLENSEMSVQHVESQGPPLPTGWPGRSDRFLAVDNFQL